MGHEYKVTEVNAKKITKMENVAVDDDDDAIHISIYLSSINYGKILITCEKGCFMSMSTVNLNKL